MTSDLGSFVRDAVNSMGFDEEERAPIDDRPDDIAPEAWERISDGQRAGILAARAGDDEDDDDEIEDGDEAPAPLKGNALAIAVRELLEDVLDDAAGEAARAGMDPADWAIWMTNASPAEWHEYCVENGWPEEIRPAREDLPVSLQTEVARRNLVKNLERGLR